MTESDTTKQADMVNHPPHYTDGPVHLGCGESIECIDVVETMSFNQGNAVKYLWRAGKKGSAAEDCLKAAWYCNREAERLRRKGTHNGKSS